MRLATRSTLLCLALALGAAGAASAQQAVTLPTEEYPGLETGKMWTFDVPPLEYWARRYNFRPSQQWLEHARLSTARLPGCTTSFVSADGLIMTNHHCARGCVNNVSRQGEDLLGNGFYARTRAEERACPNFVVDQLVEISDVTAQVNAAVPAGATADRAAAARNEASQAIQGRCDASGANTHCEVIPMYRGGQYKLHRFRRWTDARLVFVPETQVASFGGDPDNFTYPRHDFDMAFLRVYENGQPIRPEHFYRWSANGSREGDLVFVAGNPGNTSRLLTMAQLEYLRDVQNPAFLDLLARQIAVVQELGRMSPERAAASRNQLFGLQNTQKGIAGRQSGLVNNQLMERKRQWERAFRDRVNANPELRRQYGAAWDNLVRIVRDEASVDLRRRYYAFGAYGTRLLNWAGALVRMPVEMPKPDSARLIAFRDANRAFVERNLASQVPLDTTFEIRILAAYFTAMQRELPANDPVRRQALGDRTPEAAARAMVQTTQIATADQRGAVLQGGAQAVAASTDPFIQLARVIDPLSRPIIARWTALLNEEAQNGELVNRALLAVFGNTVAPDATFSLRITDGEVLRYPYNGSMAAPYTTLYGLFDRAVSFNNEFPWSLTQRWYAARDRLNMSVPVNAVSTNDVTGGNSGSPVINRDGEIVGLIHDGNMEALPLDFIFLETTSGRCVWVDSRGIIEVLRRVYDADALASELTRGN